MVPRRPAGGSPLPIPPRLYFRFAEPIRTGEYSVVRAGEAYVDPDTDDVLGYIAALGLATRTLPSVALGASPRSIVHLLAASKASARLAGRNFVTPDDVAWMATPVWRHRVLLRPEAELERGTSDDAIRAALATVPVPR